MSARCTAPDVSPGKDRTTVAAIGLPAVVRKVSAVKLISIEPCFALLCSSSCVVPELVAGSTSISGETTSCGGSAAQTHQKFNSTGKIATGKECFGKTCRDRRN